MDTPADPAAHSDLDLSTLGLLELLELLSELLPEVNWRIVSGTEAEVTSSRKAKIYWDEQDRENEGWAYQLVATDDAQAESGGLDDLDDLRNVFA